jgi:hypothetical protein
MLPPLLVPPAQIAHIKIQTSGTQQCDTYTIFNSREVAATGIWSMIGCFTAEGFYDNPRTLYRNTFPRMYLFSFSI